MRILIFGDSITEGFCDYEMGGWINMLKIYFWKKGAKFRVTNLGISGDNSEDILKRFESFQKAYNHKYQNKSIIIFSFGMNDSLLLKNGNNDINIDEFKKNIEKLIQISKDNSLISKIIFLTNTNIKR
ncbi:hypothetical protein HGA92_00980 [Candidatus Gracilibacteria bacterium]|nr:hypothetical protein [Candidatus Gracilibacteria bacterium]NUJ98816.1 hypothetical protein [Candidatus Gracilibacteria bacterium]